MVTRFAYGRRFLLALLTVFLSCSGCAKTVPMPGLRTPAMDDPSVATLTVSRPDNWASGGWSVFVYFRTRGLTSNTAHAICRTKDGIKSLTPASNRLLVDDRGGHIVFAVEEYLAAQTITIEVPFILEANLGADFAAAVNVLKASQRKGRLHLMTDEDRRSWQKRNIDVLSPRIVVPLPSGDAGDQENSFDVDWTRGLPARIVNDYNKQVAVFLGSMPLKLERADFEKLMCEEFALGTALGFLGPGGSIAVQLQPDEISLESAYVMYGIEGAEAIQRMPASSDPITIHVRPGQRAEYVFTPIQAGLPRWGIGVKQRAR